MNLLITSTGFSFNPLIQEEFLRISHNDKSLPVGIITTATDGKEENKYSKLAKDQFVNMGFLNVNFVDVEKENPEFLKKYKVIYVCGGNTFYLIYHLKKSGADMVLKELIANGIAYIGVSAGSVILSPTIDIAGAVNPDSNDVGLTDTTALGIIDFDIAPHYEQAEEQEIRSYEQKTGRTVERLTNEQAIIVVGSERKRI